VDSPLGPLVRLHIHSHNRQLLVLRLAHIVLEGPQLY
jgi:hypothetical protein